MNRRRPRSKAALFLIEMILSLLILSFAAAACVQVFAAARSYRRQAREWNHIQELIICAGEILEGSEGTAQDFTKLLGKCVQEDNVLIYSFDRNWAPCDAAQETPRAYRMELTLRPSEGKKEMTAVFYNHRDEILYEQNFCYPLPSPWKEEA